MVFSSHTLEWAMPSNIKLSAVYIYPINILSIDLTVFTDLHIQLKMISFLFQIYYELICLYLCYVSMVDVDYRKRLIKIDRVVLTILIHLELKVSK